MAFSSPHRSVTVYLPEEMYEFLRTRAHEDRKSMSKFLIGLLETEKIHDDERTLRAHNYILEGN